MWRSGVEFRLRKGGVGEIRPLRGERTPGAGGERPADRVCPHGGAGGTYSSQSEVAASSKGSALAVETTRSSAHPHIRRRSNSQSRAFELTASPAVPLLELNA